ncbi:class III lanthionine synthetase LanKC [Kineosporia babensis]|uniref:non-specific serine/threonine protein kinase n=1 Tax=Kineosporia babensis TaxID=499548 RepID=A0A9X1NIK1_9ACTN|nr:class III lanthionine synthetase LanKC [Kineosporia babensis]MCD5314798.1 class III lanthionine synthetase LanKC [Kineosporia babensis]
MDMRYVEFTYGDSFFYDRLDRPDARRRSTLLTPEPYDLSPDPDWNRWETTQTHGWHHLRPPLADLPEQGWKIHVSATLDNAAALLHLVSQYCGRHDIAFKFRPTRGDLLRSNLKYADRGSSGKFITVYPAGDQACERALTEIDDLVGRFEGPYILSDLRWNAGPLYLRYGGFRLLQVRDERDQLVAAIRRPDGVLVPDQRRPGFTPPEWLELPSFVHTAREQLSSGEEPFDYGVRKSLHYSNGGGVYLAERYRDGAVVVLKEARPHAGLGPDGRTAVQRLAGEQQRLERLRGVAATVDVLGHFQRHGHHFLVLEYIEGRSLSQELAARHPMTRAGATTQDRSEFRVWALDVLAQVEAGLREIHDRGEVHGDLHPGNILITPEGKARFIDLEADGAQAPLAGAPGFTALDGRSGVRADLYSLASLKIALFVPLTRLLPLDRHKARHLLDWARHRFGLEPAYCAEVLEQLDDRRPRPTAVHVRRMEELAATWPVESVEKLETALTRGIWESLDLSRPDRAFPGDIRQFTHEALSVAHGACGVLLAAPGTEQQREDVLDWVCDALERTPLPRPGLLDGMTGIGYTMRRFGRDEVADRLSAAVGELDFDALPSSLYSGLAGIGLDLLGQEGAASLAALEQIRKVLHSRADAPPARSGLLHGASGVALFWLCSFEVSGDPVELERARQALAVDLAACVELADGSLLVREPRRTVPYLGFGSIGVAMVAMRLLEHMDDEELRRVVRQVIRLTRAEFTVQSGLFNGRAGYVLFLAAVQASPFAGQISRVDLVRHTRDLGLYALVHGTGIHFPGEQLLRASVDWASGSAGVLTALRAFAATVHGAPAPVLPIPGLLPRKAPQVTNNERRPRVLHPDQLDRELVN